MGLTTDLNSIQVRGLTYCWIRENTNNVFSILTSFTSLRHVYLTIYKELCSKRFVVLSSPSPQKKRIITPPHLRSYSFDNVIFYLKKKYIFYFIHFIIPFLKFGPPCQGKATAAARAALPKILKYYIMLVFLTLPSPTSACWVFSS